MAMSLPFVDRSSSSLPVQFVSQPKWRAWLREQSAARRGWIESTGISGNAGDVVMLPGRDGKASGAVLVVPATPVLWDFGGLATRLPAGTWRFVSDSAPLSMTDAMVAIGLGAWKFERYKAKKSKQGPRFVWPESADKARATAMIEAISMARDLITTPSSDMGPAELAAAAQELGKAYKAKVKVIVGDELLKQNYPMVHAVGRASPRAPRIMQMRWGKAGPKLTLVGKGVCFDTGGLNIKPSSGMNLMKKDMGGAATVLGLAHMIMSLGLKVQLRVIVPAVENAISGNALRPKDILTSRKGLTVEVNDTDAEGRLVLGDALAWAEEEPSDMILSMATLTGAARVAVGPDLAPYYCNDPDVIAALEAGAVATFDPVWRLPFHDPYEAIIEPGIADLDNAPGWGFAGSGTAALFLRRFVNNARYLHFDIYAHTPSDQPARPKGGVGQGARAVFAALPAILGL